MSIWAVLLLAMAMSTDAFAVALCKGVSLRVSNFVSALKIGLLFGVTEAITPLLGWLLGYIALPYIEQWDHWVVFVLMLFLGIRMIRNSFQNSDEGGCSCDEQFGSSFKSIAILVLTAVSTSIDAFVIGAGLALASVNICFAASMIGLATCMMVTIGVLLGKKLGCVIGKRAEFFGGLVLITIGIITLFEHLS